jgi:hypothetical protein
VYDVPGEQKQNSRQSVDHLMAKKSTQVACQYLVGEGVMQKVRYIKNLLSECNRQQVLFQMCQRHRNYAMTTILSLESLATSHTHFQFANGRCWSGFWNFVFKQNCKARSYHNAKSSLARVFLGLVPGSRSINIMSPASSVHCTSS